MARCSRSVCVRKSRRSSESVLEHHFLERRGRGGTVWLTNAYPDKTHNPVSTTTIIGFALLAGDEIIENEIRPALFDPTAFVFSRAVQKIEHRITTPGLTS